MPWPPRHDRNARALVVCPDRNTAAELLPLLASHLPGAAVVRLEAYPSRADLASLLAASGPSWCFLEIESDRESALGLLSQLSGRQPAVPVIALLSGDDPDLILRCLRQGAGEFLVRPFTAEQLDHALGKVARAPAGGLPAADLARLYCVMPGKGACGATTLACNLAFHLKRLGAGKVLLADLDPLTGTMPFVLKLKSHYSFVDALAHAERLDADLWKALVSSWSGLDVLLSPEDPAAGIGDAWSPGVLVDYWRRSYRAIVLDIAGAYGPWNLSLARLSDELLLVATNELPALHAVQRAIAYLEANGVSRGQMRLVVNRYYPERGLASEQIEAALGLPVFQALPSDYEAVQKALMDGRPAPSASRFGKGVAGLAERLAGRGQPAKSGSMLAALSSWLGRKP